MKKVVILILFACLVAVNSFGQHSSWYSGDLLSNSQPLSIVEDSQGFIWIGTEYGLNKFDGYQFYPFFSDDTKPGTLTNNYVKCLHVGRNGNVWVGTARGLQLLDPASGLFANVEMPDGRKLFVSNLEILSSGEVWFAATGNGIFRVNENGTLTAERIESVSQALSGRNLNCLNEDSGGVVWIGTDSGVFQAVPSSSYYYVRQFKPESFHSNIVGVVEDTVGNVFIATNDSVYKWTRDNDNVEGLARGRSAREITRLYVDSNGVVYAAIRGEGLRYYDPERNRMSVFDDNGREPGIRHMDVSSMFMDSKSNLWLGCYMNGITMIPDKQTQFKSLRFQDYSGFSGGGITAMMVDCHGNLWCGFNNNPVTCFDREGRIIVQYQDQPFANCLYQTSDGSIWAGLYDGDIALVDTKTGEFHPTGHNEGNSPVQSILEDGKGNLYYAIRGFGFSLYNPLTKEYHHWSASSDGDDAGLENDWIQSMAIDFDGIIWIGHNTGINCFDTDTRRIIDLPPSIDQSGAPCYFPMGDNMGRVWLGMNTGLLIFDKETGGCVRLTADDGLSDNSVRGLLQDSDGNVWCSTRNGLNRIDTRTFVIDRFFSGYGLLDKAYYTRACARDADGSTLYFGSRQCITCFDPAVISNAGNVGNVVMTSFYLNNTPITENTLSGRNNIIDRPVQKAETFNLAYSDRSFTLEFSTFDYGDQDCVLFEYSFDGTVWNSTPAGVNRINFTRLNPGKYQLRVRAVSNNTRSEVSQYTIKVARPWYASAWAIVIYVFVFCFVTLVLLYVVQQKQAKELSRAKLQSFTNIAHELCSPLTMLISPLDELMHKDGLDDDVRRPLRMMHRTSSRIMSLLNQLLDIRRFDEGQMRLKCRETDMTALVQNIYEMYMYSAGHRDIRYSFDCPDNGIVAWVDRDRIEKVVTNILSNAFKYTPDKGEIRVELRTGTDDAENGPLHNYVEFSVSDTGIGLDVDDVNKVFDRFYRAQTELSSVTLGLGIGLNYSRILVQMHRGIIQAQNRNDVQGSCFWFRLPLGSSHLDPDEIVGEKTAEQSYVVPESNAEQMMAEQEGKLSNGATKGYKVLVVDDDESLLDYISYTLRAAYYKVITCRNGKEGLRLAISEEPDVIISDVVMPEMDGLNFVRALRNNPNISHIPVVLLSARNKRQDRMNGIGNGADVYLPKPFYMNELKLQVSNLIENRLRMKGRFSGDQEQKDKVDAIEVQSGDDQLMERIMNVLNTNLSNPDFSIGMLADEVGMSRTQLHRKVKNITGLSAGRFVNGIRMRQAAVLLEQKSLNISEIADRVGFGTSAHFATAFKNFYGMTPSEYIRQHDSENPEGPDS